MKNIGLCVIFSVLMSGSAFAVNVDYSSVSCHYACTNEWTLCPMAKKITADSANKTLTLKKGGVVYHVVNGKITSTKMGLTIVQNIKLSPQQLEFDDTSISGMLPQKNGSTKQGTIICKGDAVYRPS